MTISHPEHRTDSVDTPDRFRSRTHGTGTTGRWARPSDPRHAAPADTRKASAEDIAAAHDAAVAEDRERTGHTGPGRLLGQELGAELTHRLDRAVGGFVDDPRGAVREADAALEETVHRLTEALRERHGALRGTWRADAGHAEQEDSGRTEELRLALRDYRDLLRRLVAA
ncbi:hypothetical protein ACIA8O_25105 [Kitasatospora sp. NPDC051853]|uniref:hypothetical protein n=1 Tax=Kitasatospora sp. NPDC051853 TaxID=3364058 RepID=UPI0037B1C7E4